MNITTQTNKAAQRHQLQHRGVFVFNGPSNSVVANMAWQLSQEFKQIANAIDIKPCITRVRLVMHDACVLRVTERISTNVKTLANSLDPELMHCIEQNQVFFWKRDRGLISNG